jgi:bacterioferritin-associated ferredoxin
VLICHCKAVNERTIRACVAGGAHDVEAVARACGAGSRCYGCHPAIEDLIRDVLGRADSVAVTGAEEDHRAG